MKASRLDWMKFYIYDFVHSEDVEAMSAEEVGQYILLMAAAWVGGGDCTLPSDEGYLARKARGTVSAKVMKQFTQTTEGRLVNEMQREIWHEQQGMWNAASEAGKRGRAKQLGRTLETGTGGTPGVAQMSSRGVPGDKMGCDVNRKEQSNVAAASTTEQQQQSTTIVSFSTPTPTATTTKQLQSAPKPASVSKTDPSDDIDWDIISDEAKLARIFYETLPEENKEAAPQKWEHLWSEDLGKIHDDWYLIRDVINHAARKKDKSGFRIYVRAKSFVENYAKLKAETLKLRKVKANGHAMGEPEDDLLDTSAATPAANFHLTKKEQAASGNCAHGTKLKDCMECYMRAAAQ